MRVDTPVEVAGAPEVISSAEPGKLRATLAGVVKWPSSQLARSNRSHLTRVHFGVICTAILISAVGVRLLYWQDKHVEIVGGKAALSGVFDRYQKEARRMLDEGGILFPRERPASGDARMLVHPPGYSILLAAIYRLNGDPYTWLWLVQIVCDGAAALFVFLIALELINWSVGVIAAMLVAISPHLAYYSLILSPDSLAVVPLLIAIYFLIRAYKRPRLIAIIAAGAFIGLSCWLRANALLLAPFLALATLALFPRGDRLRYSAVLLGAAMIVVSPITIRNLVVFHRFVPVSIAAGENLVVGIGDYDSERRFGMPHSDRETRIKDAEWNGRPDYAASLWTPDGIERDRVRFARGLAVIRQNPGWFLGVMLRRAGFMLRYNDSSAHQWPLNTAVVPVLSAEPRFGHALPAGESQSPRSPSSAVLVFNGTVIPQSVALTDDNQPAWSSSPEEVFANGTVLSQKTAVSLAVETRILQVEGDDSEYGDQFESPLIPVHRDSDYVLAIPVRLVSGNIALKITGADRRIACALASISDAEAEAIGTGSEGVGGDLATAQKRMTVIQIPFASGKNTQVRLVVSNNGYAASRPAVLEGRPQIFEIGPTPHTWTRYPRGAVRSLQRNLFTTARMLPCVILGIALLTLARRRSVLVIVLAVPLYYLCVQAALSTEYRYILGIHYFLFMTAGVTLHCFGAAAGQASRMAARRFTMRHRADHL